jgi:hypothetical protein
MILQSTILWYIYSSMVLPYNGLKANVKILLQNIADCIYCDTLHVELYIRCHYTLQPRDTTYSLRVYIYGIHNSNSDVYSLIGYISVRLQEDALDYRFACIINCIIFHWIAL